MDKLIELDSKQAFVKLKQEYLQVCLVHLYTLEGAIQNTEFNSLSENKKKELIEFGAFLIVIVLSILIICGLPLGELTMGGFIPLWFSGNITKIIGIIMAVYLSLNMVMNFISKSKKEKYIMTPLSLISAICFWITALK